MIASLVKLISFLPHRERHLDLIGIASRHFCVISRCCKNHLSFCDKKIYIVQNNSPAVTLQEVVPGSKFANKRGDLDQKRKNPIAQQNLSIKHCDFLLDLRHFYAMFNGQ